MSEPLLGPLDDDAFKKTHDRYVRERREREAQNIANGLNACGCCPPDRCPPPCRYCGEEGGDCGYVCC